MVAPVTVGNVEDSYVRIAAKKGGQVVQADITQSIQAESDSNLHSPVNKEIEDLLANQRRQHLNFCRVTPSAAAAVNHEEDKESAPLAEAQTNVSATSTCSATETNGATPPVNEQNEATPPVNEQNEATPPVNERNEAQESRNLFQSLAPSERRSVVMRSRAKVNLTERVRFRPATKEQQLGLINKLENDISSLSKENMELRRKVTLFQELFKDREKLNKVLKKLEEKE